MHRLQNTLDMLVSEIKERHSMLGKEPKQVYASSLKVVLHVTEQTRFPEVESNLLLAKLTERVKALITSVNSLLRQRIGESSVYLKTAIDALECMRSSSEPLYIMLCDALSLPEYMFLLYSFHRFVSINDALCAINPSGKTATFKYLAKSYLGIETHTLPEEITMSNVCEGLREKLGASGCSIFRDIDMLVHHGEFRETDEMINSLFKIANKLRKEVENWLNNKYKILLLADHGYDALKSENVWILTHRWEKEKLCVSPFVSILIIG